MKIRIYLIRHGKIAIGNEKRYVGITDILLDDTGISQANLLKNYFSQMPIEQVFTSPLKRCLNTAKIICEEKQQDYIIVKDFTEINMGLWENKPIIDIKKNFPKEYEERGKNFASFLPPEGESFNQLTKRVMAAFDSIVNNYSGNIIIVSHAGVIKAIISQILGVPFQDIFSTDQPYGCVNELILNDNYQWQYKRLI
ncbi:MAG: alpha-ribazole phosphatase [Anaerocolumna sp.]|jgi:probable phosphoglycerate mutase|nr:alpha-ribazole phosphatase [Anaerocolumna sp.]